MDKKYTSIYLVRHGETDWNKEEIIQGRENTPLNKDGIIQAKELADYFFNLNDNINKIITSPLKRAAKTAEIVAEKIGKDTLYVEDDFIERDYGQVSGMPKEEREEKYPKKEYPDVEKLDDLKKRAYNALIRNVEKNRGETLIMVSHSGIINSILHMLSDGKIGTGITRHKNCSISFIKIDENNNAELIFYNKTANQL